MASALPEVITQEQYDQLCSRTAATHRNNRGDQTVAPPQHSSSSSDGVEDKIKDLIKRSDEILYDPDKSPKRCCSKLTDCAQAFQQTHPHIAQAIKIVTYPFQSPNNLLRTANAAAAIGTIVLIAAANDPLTAAKELAFSLVNHCLCAVITTESPLTFKIIALAANAELIWIPPRYAPPPTIFQQPSRFVEIFNSVQFGLNIPNLVSTTISAMRSGVIWMMKKSADAYEAKHKVKDKKD